MRETSMTGARTVFGGAKLGWAARLAAVAVICAGLPACSGLSKALGLQKSSPDEFAIAKKAPLVIPPDFALRPPRPGAPRPQEQQPANTAAQALFTGYDDKIAKSASRGETAFLSRAGALEATSSIRLILDQETAQLSRKDRSFVDMILFRSPDEDVKDAVKMADSVEGTEPAASEDAGDTAAEAERTGWF